MKCFIVDGKRVFCGFREFPLELLYPNGDKKHAKNTDRPEMCILRKMNLLTERDFCLLDGGLATELEAMGYDLRHPLWSARLLLEDESAIRKVHRAYLEAGADILISASYQLTIPGLLREGLDEAAAEAMIQRAVTLAVEERDHYWEIEKKKNPTRRKPLVAAGIGPYGAWLADGSEYRGNYGLARKELKQFHARRMALLSATSAALLACETVPSYLEAEVLAELMAEHERGGWISFSCQNATQISDGTPLRKCAELLKNAGCVWGIGINCTAPQYVTELISHIRAAGFQEAIVVYPNSGETFDGKSRSWKGTRSEQDFVEMAKQWRDLGASIIGGCCRTGPAHIAALRSEFVT